MDTYEWEKFISAFRVLSSFNINSNLNILKANSGNLDQRLHLTVSDLGLHCCQGS